MTRAVLVEYSQSKKGEWAAAKKKKKEEDGKTVRYSRARSAGSKEPIAAKEKRSSAKKKRKKGKQERATAENTHIQKDLKAIVIDIMYRGKGEGDASRPDKGGGPCTSWKKRKNLIKCRLFGRRTDITPHCIFPGAGLIRGAPTTPHLPL